MSGKIIVKGKIRIVSGDKDDILNMWNEHVRLSRLDHGCIHFDYTLNADGVTIELDEAWTDRAAFDAHSARTKTSAWATTAPHLERDLNIAEE